MLEIQRKKLLKHLILTQLVMESADDCLNLGIIRQKEKQETKRYTTSMEKMHRDNLNAMYQIDSQSFVNLTHIIETTCEEIANLSLEELLTLNKNIHEIIDKIRYSTPIEGNQQSGTNDVHEGNPTKV